MFDKKANSLYSGTFAPFDIQKLEKLAHYMAVRSSFSEAVPMIVISCADGNNLLNLESYLSSIIAISGGHAVRLGKLNKKIFLFAIKFLSADSGLYIDTDKDTFTIECLNSDGKEIENFAKEFDSHNGQLSFKNGKISGYGDIIERYIKSL